MGKPTGFLEYDRREDPAQSPLERLAHWNEFHTPLSREERRLQGARCMECGVPFCQSGAVLGGMVSGCPLHNLVPEWNDMLYQGSLPHALERLLKTNSFPEFTGRVCPALCEAACTCGLHGDPVTVRQNELGIIEDAWQAGLMAPKPPAARTGKTVAVVGSGPAGLAVADRLNRRGHKVTVLERADRPGGLLMYGIPNMKLEKSIVLRTVERMEQEGVEFRLNADVGREVDPKALLAGFDAVALCTGAKEPRDLRVPGRDAAGVLFAVDYLTQATQALLDGRPNAAARDLDVVVVGGGDTGNDCVATALRQGARSVTQLEMMPCPPETRAPNNPWPQWPRVKKTDYGQQEAAAKFGADPRVFETTVRELTADGSGALTQVVTVKLAPKTDRKTGRTRMDPIPGSEQTLPCQLLLIAAGFLGPQSYLFDALDLPLPSPNAPQDPPLPSPYHTSVPGLFTAGDARRGQSLVVWAIREGRECARQIDLHLMGYTNL